MTRQNLIASLIILLVLLLSACAPAATSAPASIPPTEPPADPTGIPPTAVPPSHTPESAKPANPTLILATTTSTQDSGLLDVLVPQFQEQTGYTVQTVAVGSGQAMEMGQQGNADVLLVHSPAAEKQFMADGWGKERELIMHNDFIIVGPAEDPAKIKGLSSTDAFKAIAAAGATFAARADKSGTSTKELGIWKKAEVDPATEKPAWYLETGQGMGPTLTIASEKGAYTLTDRATYLANQDNLQLEILSEGDPGLLNIYHVMTVNPDKWPKVNYEGAVAFMEFMTDPATQEVIGQFGTEKFGQPLFFPDAGESEDELGSSYGNRWSDTHLFYSMKYKNHIVKVGCGIYTHSVSMYAF